MQTAGGRTLPWDASVLRYAESHYQASIVTRLNVALKISLGIAGLIAAGAVIMVLTGRKRRRALFWALAVGGVLALDYPLKEVFQRPTLGDQGEGYSFPSGNAMVSAAVLAAAVLTVPRWRRRVVALGMPLLIGYGAALVYAWWHYPSDVVGGWCVAFAWVAGLWFALCRR